MMNNKIQNLQSLVDFNNQTTSESVTVIDFYADWCGPCKAIAPAFERLAEKVKGVNFYKLNIEEGEGTEISQKYRITSIPTFLVFKGGQQIGRYNSLLEVERLVTEYITVN